MQGFRFGTEDLGLPGWQHLEDLAGGDDEIGHCRNSAAANAVVIIAIRKFSAGRGI